MTKKADREGSAAEELYTIRQAARYVNISEPILRLTIRCGKIPAQGKGKAMRVRKSDLLPFVDPLAANPARKEIKKDLAQTRMAMLESAAA